MDQVHISKKSKKVAPSHEVVQCGVCNKKIRNEHLKGHFSVFHKGYYQMLPVFQSKQYAGVRSIL